MAGNYLLKFHRNKIGTYTCDGFDYEYISSLSVSAGTLKMKFVTIPSHVNGIAVTEVADKAFMQCNYLQEIHIPETVTHVGDMAFADVNTLHSVRWKGSPTNKIFIGMLAFADCNHLEHVVIDGFLHMNGHHAFRNCFQLCHFTCKHIEYVPSDFFLNCKRLAQVTFTNCGKLNRSSFAGTSVKTIRFTENDAPVLCDGTVQGFIDDSITLKCPSGNPLSQLVYEGVTVIVEN